ncbi:acyl-CoA carboxylase epsilon subunit [Streptomyces sp. NPDC001604]|uniref:acyl-CoA carboxylase epsilon subunit n=1 Tax=Streptomyces sp. NPDC001604 TaxID=3364593 RepID=UPI0036CB1699
MTCWRITGGTPTAQETAALTAVLTAVLARHTAAREEAQAAEGAAAACWHRPHRNPHPPAGAWRTG